MSVYSIRFSPTGGTEQVMALLSSAWEEVIPVDLSLPREDYGKYHFTGEDLCLIGFPTFEGRVPPVVLERLSAMGAEGTPTVLVAVYGNRAVDDALLELKNALLPLGFRPFAAVSAVAQHSLLPMFAAGRPDEADAEELRDMSRRLRAAAESEDVRNEVAVPGKEPYIVIPGPHFYPQYDAGKCTHCMTCAQHCPTACIDQEDPSKVDREACASCMRCVSLCPTGAWHLDSAWQEAASRKLAPRFEGRKPNTLYL